MHLDFKLLRVTICLSKVELFSWYTFMFVKAQKELLDAELDLYKKTQAGEDTAMLKIKYTQLQIEVITLSWKRKLSLKL